MKDYTPQQKEAIEKLHTWRVGALFMEAGTGKTLAAINLVNSSPCSNVIWIGPLRTLGTVRNECSKWGGFNIPSSYFGVESISMSDRIYMELLALIENSANPFVVVDESLKIKNATAKRTRRIIKIGKIVKWKLILNGTPISRNLLDMWPQMEFLSPQILCMSLCEFKNTFCKYTTITKRVGASHSKREVITGMENVDYLHSLIRHYVYECDLNMKISQKWNSVHYAIGEDNRRKYKEIKKRYLKNDSLDLLNNNIFMSMTTEMQHSYATEPNKIKAVKELFAHGVEPSKTIIFCRWISSQELCRNEFNQCAVLSIQKESFGLNLQHYKNTIYFDKVWDYALYIQSSRRTFRTGQEQDCHYYELTGNIGLDRLIDENIQKKVTMSEYLKHVTKEQMYESL